MAEEKKTEKGGRIVKDPELVAMQEATDLIEGIEDEAMRCRVVRWIVDRYAEPTPKPT